MAGCSLVISLLMWVWYVSVLSMWMPRSLLIFLERVHVVDVEAVSFVVWIEGCEGGLGSIWDEVVGVEVGDKLCEVVLSMFLQSVSVRSSND